MNRWLLRAPLWALTVLCGIPIAVVLALVLHYGRHQSWPGAVVAAVLCGLVGGWFTAGASRRQMTRYRAAIGDVPDGVRDTVASRGTVRGRLPSDPIERAATADLIDNQIAELRRRRVAAVVLFPLAMVLFGWFAIARSPLWWLAAVAVAVAFVLVLRTPAMLERRAERLRQGPVDE